MATRVYVFCYLPGEVDALPAGRFDHDAYSGVGSFAYGLRYRERPDALPVDPVALPLGLEPAPVTTNGGLYGGFRGTRTGERCRRTCKSSFGAGSSLGGARPKCTVMLDGEMWLAKFPSRHDWRSVPRLEFATMRLAALCGLKTPETRLETIGGRDVYLVRRFDRAAVTKGWARR